MSHANVIGLYNLIKKLSKRIHGVDPGCVDNKHARDTWFLLDALVYDLQLLLEETERCKFEDLYNTVANVAVFELESPCVEAIYKEMREAVLEVVSGGEAKPVYEFCEFPCIHQLADDMPEDPVAYVMGKRSVKKITRVPVAGALTEDYVKKHTKIVYQCLRDLAKHREYAMLIRLLRRCLQEEFPVRACVSDDLFKIVIACAQKGESDLSTPDYSVCADLIGKILEQQALRGVYADFEEYFGKDAARALISGYAPNLPATLNSNQRAVIDTILADDVELSIPASVLRIFYEAVGGECSSRCDAAEKKWRDAQRKLGWIAPAEYCDIH